MELTVKSIMDEYVVDGDNGRYLDIKELIGDVALEQDSNELLKLSVIAGKISKILYRQNDDDSTVKVQM